METLYEGFGWKVTMEEAPLPNGKVKKVARVGRADSVQILALVGPQKILLLREFRPYYGEYIWMLPGGRVDKENDVAGGAQRELQEETGYRAEKLEKFWTVNHSESFVSANHVFLAEDLVHDPLDPDPDELMEVHETDIREALRLVESSTKVHLPSAYALRRYIDERL